MTISVIIPTIKKSLLFETSIKEIQREGDEIILIDNAPTTKKYPGIVHLRQDVNLGVNPSWNLGASVAKGDILVLMNDDILVDWSSLRKRLKEIFEDTTLGLVGVWNQLLYGDVLGWVLPSSEEERKMMFSWVGNYPLVEMDKVYDPTNSHFLQEWFGVLIALRRENYCPIPSELVYWFGDNFLCDQVLLKDLSVKGISLFPLGSNHTSSGSLPRKVMVTEAIKFFSLRKNYEEIIKDRRLQYLNG